MITKGLFESGMTFPNNKSHKNNKSYKRPPILKTATYRNPFTPSFGISPPVLAGRDDIITDWDNALETGPRHPDYTLLFLGMRGAGKTAMLNEVEDRAKTRGWITISEDCTHRGLLSRITKAAVSFLTDFDLSSIRGRVTNMRAAGLGFEPRPLPEPSQDLRTVLTRLADLLETKGAGLLITVDEMQGAEVGEIRRFGSIIQHVTRREERSVAFVGAGLPGIEDRFLSGDAVTFLQRCSRRDIGPLDDRAAATALEVPIRDLNASITPDALRAAVRAVSGYAFMTQLVGFHMWKAASDPYAGITSREAAAGIAEAERQLGRLVLEPIWKTLSAMDRRFLLAMTQDSRESRLAEVANRLKRDVGYAGVYRSRLIQKGMIVPVRKGWIAFAHHTTRQWLKQLPPGSV